MLKMLIIACAIIVGLFTKIYTPKADYDLLTSENVEALASGEVEIPAICANISQELCILFDDGYFILGVRVA